MFPSDVGNHMMSQPRRTWETLLLRINGEQCGKKRPWTDFRYCYWKTVFGSVHCPKKMHIGFERLVLCLTSVTVWMQTAITKSHVTFQFIRVVSVKMSAFWDRAPCSVIEADRRFRGVYCLHHQGIHHCDDRDSMHFWNVWVRLHDAISQKTII
jgi:hypothetical protein